MKYTFTMDHEDGSTVTITGHDGTIYNVLDSFKSFLLASTYSQELVDEVLGFPEEIGLGK